MAEFVFVDSRVAGQAGLLAGLPVGATVVVLDPDEDGLTQMVAALAGVTGLDSIHIISLGSSGTLFLGSSALDEALFDRSTGYGLGQIGAALSAGGDILLYGSNVAAGPARQSFLDRLATYTAADVGASDDATGSSLLGGDRVLEQSTGSIEASVAVSTAAQAAATPPSTAEIQRATCSRRAARRS